MGEVHKFPQSPTARLEALRTELKVAQAELASLQARKARGELIDRKRFEDRAFTFLRSVRDRLLGMSARHAAVFAAQMNEDPAELAARIDAEMLRICKAVALKCSYNPVYYRALWPDPVLTVSQWADQHRMLSSRSASEAGPYRTNRTPYLREIMDCLSVTSTVQRIIVKKGSQLGFTEAGNCWLGYIIDHVPGPVLAVQPTVELAKRFSKQRIEPLIAESPRLRERINPARARDSGNTMLLKEFTGGVLIITGANSAVGLRSMPARFLFCDELDAYPGDIEGEGDPLALAEARTATFSYRAKKFYVSTPLIKGGSRISREYEKSDQRHYFVPCPVPGCGTMQVLEFKQLRWRPGKPEDAVYQCPHCEGTFPEAHKTEMLAAGEWRATAESTDRYTRGYHLSALYSPLGWLSWAEIAKQWEAATNDADARKTFVNTVLGEEYEEEAEAVPDWQRLYERREDWPHHTIPERGLFLTAGADIQQDRIEIDVWAWGRSLECWLVEHIVVNGDPGRPDIWSQMDALLTRTWVHETGARLALQRLAIDTGYATQSVYAWARSQDHATVLPVRGYAAYDRLVPVSGPTKVEVLIDGRKFKRGLNLWTVSSSFFKKEIYKRLQLAKPTDEQQDEGIGYPPGYVHISLSASDEWCRQLVAEQQVIVRTRRGFQARTEWRLLRPRNEALDCLVYARAAVWLAGADRWAEARWRGLEDQLGLGPPQAAPPPPPSPPPESPPSQGPPAGSIAARYDNRRRHVSHLGRW